MSALAPVVLFAYNRPEHTRRTLDALAANEMAADSDVFVFVDGPRDIGECEKVDDVRTISESASGFRSAQVVQRTRNFGLAHNIIEGVTEIVRRYGRVIVLEDDIVTSPHFLRFMNEALERYEERRDVWHISGWNYPIDSLGLPEAFFWRVMNCWGWATWADRWAYFEKDPDRLVTVWTGSDIKRFNLDGAHNFWAQVVANRKGRIDTWAIFWYATIFEHGGLCLNPTQSFVQNIGHDGSGTHCGWSSEFDTMLRRESLCEWCLEIEENKAAVSRVQDYLSNVSKNNLLLKLIRWLKPTINGALGKR